jgi:hypothetical protein
MIRYIDIEELALYILKIDETSEQDTDDLIEEGLYEEFGINVDNFIKLLNKLVPLIDVAGSPLTHTLYKGFAYEGCWLLKIPVERA